jgi:hypothetical protein
MLVITLTDIIKAINYLFFNDKSNLKLTFYMIVW